MQSVNHLNYATDAGQVYCRMRNTIISPSPDTCSDCKLFFGSLQGEGVECNWVDESEYSTMEITNPTREQLRVNSLIDNGVITEEPIGLGDL